MRSDVENLARTVSELNHHGAYNQDEFQGRGHPERALVRAALKGRSIHFGETGSFERAGYPRGLRRSFHWCGGGSHGEWGPVHWRVRIAPHDAPIKQAPQGAHIGLHKGVGVEARWIIGI